MLEVWCEEFSPDTFYEQTARTFIAARKGRIATHQREAERDLILAYNTGMFAQASKPKPLSYYLKQIRGGGERSLAADAVNFFGGLKAKGIPVSIKRVPRVASAAPSAEAY